MTEAQTGSWDDDFDEEKKEEKKKASGSANNGQAEFMRMDKSGQYKVRLVGKYVKFRRHWKPYRAITVDENRNEDPAWKAGFYPNQRYAINVIDREDGKLKILEKGSSVFKHFYNYRKATGTDPASKEGPDFVITVTIPTGDDGEPNKLKTEYGVVNLDKAPFTAEDKKVIFKTDEEGNFVKSEDDKLVPNLWPIARIFKPTDLEKVKELWDNLSDDKKIAPKRDNDKQSVRQEKSSTQAPATPEPAPVESAPEGDVLASGDDGENPEDLF